MENKNVKEQKYPAVLFSTARATHESDHKPVEKSQREQ
jgi:hypothetical protein